jgi:predicted porin
VPRVGDADTFAYYLEAKYKFTPRFFGALRWNQQFFSKLDIGKRWGNDLAKVDIAASYRFSSHAQLKLQYSFQQETTGPRDDNHIIAAQLTIRF